MGRVKEYDDCYAQVRKFNDHNISICYWNNNVSLNDFKWKDDIGYVYEHEGDYQGLRAKIRITLEERKLRRLFRKRDERGPVRFAAHSIIWESESICAETRFRQNRVERSTASLIQ